MDEMQSRLLKRFARAFLSSAVSTMVLVNPVTMNASWQDLGNWLVMLAFAGLVGGITGAIQAADLYFRNNKWSTKEP